MDTVLLSRLEIFSGEGKYELQAWLGRFELLTGKCAKDEKARFLLGLLGGKAFEYCSVLPEQVRKDYGQLKQSLLDRFGRRVNALHAYSEFTRASREPGETVQDFAERVRKLALQAYPDPTVAEANCLQQFICGLNDPSLQSKLLVKDVQSLKAAVSHSHDIQRQHEALEAMGACSSGRAAAPVRSQPSDVDRLPVAPATETMSAAVVANDDRLDQIRRQLESIQASLSQGATAPAHAVARSTRAARCWKCGAPGHMRINCPQLTSTSETRRPAAAGRSACYLCGDEDHWAARCPLKASGRGGLQRGPVRTEPRGLNAERRPFCYCCGSEGHWMAQCPHNPTNMRSSVASTEGCPIGDSEN